jgi:hypothetical protein
MDCARPGETVQDETHPDGYVASEAQRSRFTR